MYVLLLLLLFLAHSPHHHHHHTTATGCVAVSCVFVYFTLPEAKGLTQEEIAEVTSQHPIWGPLTGTTAHLTGDCPKSAAAKAVEV